MAADTGYAGKSNREFLVLNKIEYDIMRKNSTTAKLTESLILRDKAISIPFRKIPPKSENRQ
jgi:hypothetical protein